LNVCCNYIKNLLKIKKLTERLCVQVVAKNIQLHHTIKKNKKKIWVASIDSNTKIPLMARQTMTNLYKEVSAKLNDFVLPLNLV
jgi:hypothetical protein